MSKLALKATFQGNVRVGTGSAGNGLDEIIDRELPLGVGAVKGILRDEARWLLPGAKDDSGSQLDHRFVEAVFGSTRIECPWNFDVAIEAAGDNAPSYQDRPNLQLDSEGSLVPGAFLVKEEATIKVARISVYKRRPLSRHGLPTNVTNEEDIERLHLALIHLSARAVEKIGQRRSRGLGWVAFELDDEPVKAEERVKTDLDLLWPIRNGGTQ